MTTTEIVLTCVFGSLGYLLVGWATCVVVAAKNLDYANCPQYWTLWAIPLWPLVAVVGACVAAVLGSAPLTNKAIKKLNPSASDQWI